MQEEGFGDQSAWIEVGWADLLGVLKRGAEKDWKALKQQTTKSNAASVVVMMNYYAAQNRIVFDFASIY